jgi:hypothetical protein
MKKVSLPLIVLICSFLTQNAFSQRKMKQQGDGSPMQVGSTFFNAGIGVGAAYQDYNYGTAFGFKLSAEFGLWQAGPGVITLGPEIGGSVSTGNYYGYASSGKATSHTFVVAGRAAWHYGWGVPNLDTYGGASAGVGFHHYYNPNPGAAAYQDKVIPVVGVFVGASYFIKPNFGFNAEAGYDITMFQVGIVLKL